MELRGLVVVSALALVVAASSVANLTACGDAYDGETTDAGATEGGTDTVVPQGWLAVAVTGTPATADAALPSCPPYWTDARRLVDNPRPSSDACSCSCGNAPSNPCHTGTVEVVFNNGGSACNDQTATIATDGACHAPSFTGGNVGAAAPTHAPGAVACPATAAPAPIVDDGAISVCTSPQPLPCTQGMCVGRVDVPVCLMREGADACPSGFPTRRTLFDARTIRDGRTCNACSCTSAAKGCNDGKTTFYEDPLCAKPSQSFKMDGQCNPIMVDPFPAGVRYNATPDTMACTAVPATVPSAGSFELPPKQTVCCR